MALRNISDADPLRHNDDECHHQIIILFKVVNDAVAPCCGLVVYATLDIIIDFSRTLEPFKKIFPYRGKKDVLVGVLIFL